MRITGQTVRDVTIDGRTFPGCVDGSSVLEDGQEATFVNALWFNIIQELLVSIVLAAGLPVPDSNNIDLDILVKAIQRISGSRLEGSFIFLSRYLPEAYLTKHGIVRVKGQILAKADYPAFYDGSIERFHADKDNLDKLSLGQVFRTIPRATATGVELPHLFIDAAQAKYRYGYVGSFANWGYLDLVTKATRCNLICWNYENEVFCTVSDALTGGATIREIDPRNVTNGHSDWTVPNIGGAAKNWRYLAFGGLGYYYLIYDDGGKLKYYTIERTTKSVVDEGLVQLKPSGNPDSDDWFATDGFRRSTFAGYPVNGLDHSDSGNALFNTNLGTAQSYFATSENGYVFFRQNDTKLYHGFRADGNALNDAFGIALLRYGFPTFDNLHYLFFNDRKNWMYGQNSGGWKLEFMVDGIFRHEDYGSDRILGVCQSPDYYAVASAGVITNTRGNSGVDFYAKTRSLSPELSIQT